MWDRILASLRSASRFDLGYLRLVVPARLALAIVIPLVIGQLTDSVGLGVNAALGAFVCGVADTGDSLPLRARSMLVTSAALMLTALVGGLISENHILIVAVSIPVAAGCGYLAAFGPNASLTGMLALVIFTILAGSPVDASAAVQQALAVLAGALLQTAFALSGWLTKRATGVRGEVADLWRLLAVAAAGSPQDMLSAKIPAQLVHAANGIGLSGVEGTTRSWFQQLVDAAQNTRVPLASIAAERAELVAEGRQSSDEYQQLTAFSVAASKMCRQVARALVLPMRRRHLAACLATLKAAGQDASNWAPDQVADVIAAAERVAGQMHDPFPIGPGSVVMHRLPADLDAVKANARSSWRLDSPIARHAIRLAVAIPIAWIVGWLALSAHQYWVALTIAWVTRPGYGMTIGRVVSRTLGTIAGLVLIGLVVWIVSPGDWGLIVICAIAGYVLYALLPVNYTLAVVFVTSFVVALLAIGGSGLLNSLENRFVGTILGGLIALIVSQFGVIWAGPQLAQRLGQVAKTGRGYVDAIARGADARSVAQPLIEARQAATAALEEAKFEPRRGNFEPDRAERVLDAMLIGIFCVASETNCRPAGGYASVVDMSGLDQDFDRLCHRLEMVADGDVDLTSVPLPSVPPRLTDQDSIDSARAAIKRSLAYLGDSP